MSEISELAAMAEVNEKLQAIERNEPLVFKLGRRKYKIKRLSNWTTREINKLLFALQKKKFVEVQDVLDSDSDRVLMPKIISLAILARPIKVALFHWYLWRKLDKNCDQQDFDPIISKIISNSDMPFFSRNLASLHTASMMEAEMTKEVITTIIARQNSERETTSLSPSTDK